jgi:hypothetical protein
VQGGIRVTDIAGSHFSMMAEPGVTELIEGLRREIEALDGRPQDYDRRADSSLTTSTQ